VVTVSERAEAMTIRDLRRALTRLVKENPQIADFVIEMEGCDCYGALGAVMLEGDFRKTRRVSFKRGEWPR
jgi:hypothetical protein